MRITRTICVAVCAVLLVLGTAAPAFGFVWKGAPVKTGGRPSWHAAKANAKAAGTVRAAEAAGPDAFENDDAYNAPGVTALTLGVQTGVHNFYPNAGSTFDQDWFSFTAVAGQTYDMSTALEGASAVGDPIDQVPMALLDSAGNTLVDNYYKDWWGDPTTQIVWTAPASGTYYIVCWDYFDVFASEHHAIEYSLNASSLGTVATGTVGRIGGADRYEVAATLAKNEVGTYAGVTHIIIASGLEKAMADALSASGLAGTVDGPVLLVRADRAYLPAPTKAAIQACITDNPGATIQFHIVGGPASVPVALQKQLMLAASNHATIERISGADRYAVAANVAAHIRSHVGAGFTDLAFVVNGQNPTHFPDALAASPAAAGLRAPILLVKSTVIPPATAAALKFYPDRVVLGIPGKAIYQSLFDQLNNGTAEWVEGGTRDQVARTFVEYWEGTNTPTYTYTVTNKLTDALTAGCAPVLGYNFVLYVNADLDSDGFTPSSTESIVELRRAHSPALTIVGGEASVSPAVETRLNELVGNY
jgi:putative cell wall-binding protein